MDFKITVEEVVALRNADVLTPREGQCLLLQFNADLERRISSRQVALMFDAPIVRVEQITAKALRKVNHGKAAKVLKTLREGAAGDAKN